MKNLVVENKENKELIDNLKSKGLSLEVILSLTVEQAKQLQDQNFQIKKEVVKENESLITEIAQKLEQDKKILLSECNTILLNKLSKSNDWFNKEYSEVLIDFEKQQVFKRLGIVHQFDEDKFTSMQKRAKAIIKSHVLNDGSTTVNSINKQYINNGLNYRTVQTVQNDMKYIILANKDEVTQATRNGKKVSYFAMK